MAKINYRKHWMDYYALIDAMLPSLKNQQERFDLFISAKASIFQGLLDNDYTDGNGDVKEAMSLINRWLRISNSPEIKIHIEGGKN